MSPARLRTTALTLFLVVGPAGAEDGGELMCLDQKLLSAQLDERYGEVLAWAGVNSTGALIATYANPETGSWTQTLRIPGGAMACVTQMGRQFIQGGSPEDSQDTRGM